MSIIATVISNLYADYPTGLDKNELRDPQFGLWKAMLNMNSKPDALVTKEIKELAANSWGQTINIPVYKKQATRTAKSVRSCNIACNETETAFQTMTFSPVVESFCIVPAIYDNNAMSETNDYMRLTKDVIQSLLKKVNSDVYTLLDTNKSTVTNATSMVGAGLPLQWAGGAIQVPKSEHAGFFDKLMSIMHYDDFYSTPFYTLNSESSRHIVNYYINQGKGNSANTEYAFKNFDFNFTTSLADRPGVIGTGFVVPNGSVGFATRITSAAKREVKTSKGNEWEKVFIPELGFEVGVYSYSLCEDRSSMRSDLTQTDVWYYEFSFDIGYIASYNSNPAVNPGPIKKYEFLAGEFPPPTP